MDALGTLLRQFFRRQPQRRKPGLPRLLAGNALVLAFLFSIVALIGEAHYRFFFDSTESFGLTKTTKRWFSRHFEKNNSGFRDSVDYLRTMSAGKRRVTFLGDSFTVGHGVADVEDRFANQVRAMRPGWEVHVLASPGWDTGRELEIMEIYSDQDSQIDVVALIYCLNDIADIVPEWQDILHRIYAASTPGFWVQNSYLFNTLYYRWKVPRDPDTSSYYDFVLKNYEGAVWENQKRRLQTLRDFVDAQGGQLVVVTFPFVHNLGPDYQYRRVHARLDEVWRDLKVPHLDLLKVFEADPTAELVVNSYDAHPNERAHAIAAESIATFIDEQLPNLKPPDPR